VNLYLFFQLNLIYNPILVLMWPPSEVVLIPGCPYQERLQSKSRLRLVLGQPGSGNVPKIIAQQFINYQLAKNKFQNLTLRSENLWQKWLKIVHFWVSFCKTVEWWKWCWWLKVGDDLKTLVTEFRCCWHLLNVCGRR